MLDLDFCDRSWPTRVRLAGSLIFFRIQQFLSDLILILGFSPNGWCWCEIKMFVYLVITAAAFALFDVAYFLRCITTLLLYICTGFKRMHILEDSVINGNTDNGYEKTWSEHGGGALYILYIYRHTYN